MAGLGLRLAKHGYKEPKPLIQILGKPIVIVYFAAFIQYEKSIIPDVISIAITLSFSFKSSNFIIIRIPDEVLNFSFAFCKF